VDPSALIIAALDRLGLAWNVVRIAPERQADRLAARQHTARETPAKQAA
jgi:stearoyl-CoA desaturase (delta-9 desaturase)